MGLQRKGQGLGQWLPASIGGPVVLDRVWSLVFGPPDLGPVDFGTLRRRATPNDALACPEGFCPHATADLVPPVFDLPEERLRAVLAEVALAERGTVRLDAGTGRERYVVRTRILRYPDTVNVRVIPQGEGRSTLALYSRSQVGRSDLGANRARLVRWLRRIAERAGGPSA